MFMDTEKKCTQFCLKNIGKVDAVVIKFIKTLVQIEPYFNIFW